MSKVILISIVAIFMIVAVVLVASYIAESKFNQQVKEEVRIFFKSNLNNHYDMVQEEDLKGLPNAVQEWLKYAQVVGKDRIRAVRLKQQARMRLDKERSWMPLKAEQYMTTDQPGFIWKARIKMAPLVYIVGRDMYQDGKGYMLIKILSLFKVVDAKSAEIDQGTLLRYLGEMVWYPTAALSDYIEWEELDAHSAKATMSYGGVTASGTFFFNEKGAPIKFTAERYMEKNGETNLEDWLITIKEYKEFKGIRIPNKGEVTWQLEDGDYTWFDFEITDVDYNKPFVY